MKSLMVEAKKLAMLPKHAQPNYATRNSSDACKAFMGNVKLAVFYGTPHSGSDAANLAKKLQKVYRLPFLAGILKNLQPFERSMEELSVEFEDAARADINIFAFAEGRPISLLCGLNSVRPSPYYHFMIYGRVL